MVVGNPLRYFTSVLVVLGLILACLIVWPVESADPVAKAAEKNADKNPAKSKYLRIVHDARDRTIGLETAIVSFGPATPQAANVQVDLVAAVHIADKAYYEELNKRFAHYDAVLYELVAPEGTKIPKGGRKDKQAGNLLTGFQLGMKDMLKLEFQLDQVDYTCKNFVHADLSPDQFTKSMKDRKEGFSDIFARLLAYGLAKQAQGDDGGEMQLFMALFQNNRSLALKRAMADQFQEMEGMTAAFEGPKGSTLIGERNKRAIDVLKREIAAGKKKIAIFYGGGHMTNMEKRLREELSLKPTRTEWLQAWDMK